MATVSVVISAHNEETNLGRCLASAKWADELVVVDSGSTDETVEIARKFTKKIFSRPNNPMLNVNKNFGFSKASGDWILSLDADEEVPQSLVQEIKKVLQSSNSIVGYWIPRKNILFGKWIRHGIWGADKQLRLFMRGKGRFPQKHVHEYLEVDGPTGGLTQFLTHYNYQTISQYLRKLDQLYTLSEVANLEASGYRFEWRDAIRFPVSDFLKIYFAQKGYKDGLHGLVLGLLQAFYSFIVFAKLWERREFLDHDIPLESLGKEFERARKEFGFWETTALIREEPGWAIAFLLRVKRKLLSKTS